ncbi:nuclear transport factor 2 family protein [Paeniglutamicibacter sp. MACA_103]|uniref:nuclear transport factor 2 family protein n=1 Tax=Paeniglutamicibacter sp. MACA_103 TaxID=3377337 RepID=UPI0038962404
MSNIEDNKRLVQSFMDTLVSQGPEVAFDTYCDAENYTQHNPRLVNGREGFLEFGRNVSMCKGFTLTVRRMSAEDDLVWVQAETTGFHWSDEPDPVDPESLRHVFMDIFRIADGKLVEHWDVYQRIPPFTASGNDMI